LYDFKEKGSLGKKISILLIVLILMVLGATSLVKDEKVLIIEDVDHPMKTELHLPDGKFTLGYIHSVLLTPAEEYFSVADNNQLKLYKTIYESFGVGLPYSQEKWDFDIKDGKFILKVQRVTDAIHLRVSPIPKHWVSIGEERYELIDLVAVPEDLVKIYVVKEQGFRIGKKFIKLF
jgi:hypothetical protein